MLVTKPSLGTDPPGTEAGVRAAYGSVSSRMIEDEHVDAEDGYSTEAVLDQIAAWLGIALHAELAYLPFLLTFFIAPIFVTLAIYVGWFVLLRRIVKHRDEHPRLILALPIVEAAVWVALMTIGV